MRYGDAGSIVCGSSILYSLSCCKAGCDFVRLLCVFSAWAVYCLGLIDFGWVFDLGALWCAGLRFQSWLGV